MAALKASPLEWLLGKDNPPVRYLALTELLDRPPHDPEVIQAREAIWRFPPVPRLLEALEDAPRDLDTLFRFGIPPGHPAIQKACDKWLEVEHEPGASCYPEQTIGGLVRYADLDDPRLQAKITFVVRNQSFADGNRPGTGLRYGHRGACCGAHSCFSAVARGLWALAGVPENRRTPEVRDFLQRGARFLAAHRVYQQNHHAFKPVKAQFVRLHLPFALGWRTDLMDLLDAATQIGLQDDPSLVDALRLVLARQNARGRWPVEERLKVYPGLLAALVADVERVGQESKWITLTALKQLKRCARLVSRICAGEEFPLAAEPPAQPRFADYPFPYEAADRQRVAQAWDDLGMSTVLEGLVHFAREHRLQVSWHWGFVMGPRSCREWCAANARKVPAKGMRDAWPVSRVFFLARGGQFTPEGLAKRLRMPLRDQYRTRRKPSWIDQTLWRVGVEPWDADYDEVGVTLRKPAEFSRLRRVMREALAAVRMAPAKDRGRSPRRHQRNLCGPKSAS